jgi:hypothetical protein
MKETTFARRGMPLLRSSLIACVATVLELDPEEIPHPGPDEDAATGWTISRWLGGRGLGIVPVAGAQGFSWPGPWIGRATPARGEARHVVMYGVPSGVVWDPAGDGAVTREDVDAGYVLAASDIALALPKPADLPTAVGTVESIWIAPSAGEPAIARGSVRALAGQGLAGDRHVSGRGTFPSGLPGSALTLIEAEVCESFTPALSASEHRRNLVTRGISLNGLVGHEFTIGAVRCRGMRLCEPCTVADGYAGRPVLRALVHRGGLRADILADGEIAVGDAVRPV